VRLDLLLRGHLDLAHLAPARVEARAHLVAFIELIQAGLDAIARDRRTVGDLQLLLDAGAGGDLQRVLVLVDLLHHAGELAARAVVTPTNPAAAMPMRSVFISILLGWTDKLARQLRHASDGRSPRAAGRASAQSP